MSDDWSEKLNFYYYMFQLLLPMRGNSVFEKAMDEICRDLRAARAAIVGKGEQNDG